MSNLVDPTKLDQSIIDSIVLRGDLSGLKEEQLTGYYNYRCQQVGLDPSAKPFDLLVLSGKKVLYANAGATQQLSNLHGLSTAITNRERVENVYLVSVRCTGKDGRSSENQGAVDISGLSGEKLANALMKATTKAIRRTVLAHCGLGMLDETELQTAIQKMMRDSEALVTFDGRVLATWKSAKASKRFSPDALKAEMPEVYERYVIEQPGSRRFLIK